jgi:hypothetical protein
LDISSDGLDRYRNVSRRFRFDKSVVITPLARLGRVTGHHLSLPKALAARENTTIMSLSRSEDTKMFNA